MPKTKPVDFNAAVSLSCPFGHPKGNGVVVLDITTTKPSQIAILMSNHLTSCPLAYAEMVRRETNAIPTRAYWRLTELSKHWLLSGKEDGHTAVAFEDS